MPESIQNEKNLELGLKILNLLNTKRIAIENMDKDGFLHISCK